MTLEFEIKYTNRFPYARRLLSIYEAFGDPRDEHSLIGSGRFEEIDTFFQILDIDNSEPDDLFCYLTATLTCASKIPSRKAFYQNIVNSFKKRGLDIGEEAFKGLMPSEEEERKLRERQEGWERYFARSTE